MYELGCGRGSREFFFFFFFRMGERARDDAGE